jgi:hypothetical protein
MVLPGGLGMVKRALDIDILSACVKTGLQYSTLFPVLGASHSTL